MAAAELYRTLPTTTGYATDYRESGAVRLALSPQSEAELAQIATTAQQVGLPVEFVDHRRLRELYPVLQDVSAVRSALWSPTCGYLQPNSLVDAYVHAARDLGATVTTHSPVESIGVRDGAVHSVRTSTGEVSTETVVVVTATKPRLSRMGRLSSDASTCR